MPGSQEIKGEECSDSAIANSLAVGLTLWQQGLSGRLSRRRSGLESWRTQKVGPESDSGSGSGLYTVVFDAQLSGRPKKIFPLELLQSICVVPLVLA